MAKMMQACTKRKTCGWNANRYIKCPHAMAHEESLFCNQDHPGSYCPGCKPVQRKEAKP